VQWMTISPIWATSRVPLRRTALYCRAHAVAIGFAGRSAPSDSSPANSPGTEQSYSPASSGELRSASRSVASVSSLVDISPLPYGRRLPQSERLPLLLATTAVKSSSRR
jgi:hypothetical protein